jgi:hypothetical protein
MKNRMTEEYTDNSTATGLENFYKEVPSNLIQEMLKKELSDTEYSEYKIKKRQLILKIKSKLKMKQEIIDLVKSSGFEPHRMLLSFMDVETGGKGFDDKTGKLIIQFEPVWFKKNAPYAPSGLWSLNKVDVQAKEWLAFNNAFALNPTAAMESTSIGLPQIMGSHWKRLGFASVNEMWDDAKKGIPNQIAQLIKFINTDPNLLKAINDQNWDKIASIYNGSHYKELAKKIGRTPYDESMAQAYEKYANI